MRTYQFWVDFDLTRIVDIEAESFEEAEERVNAMTSTQLCLEADIPLGLDATVGAIEAVDPYGEDNGDD